MNKLDALIAELCPQGVERKRLGDIGVVVRGNGLQKKDFTESGVGCIHYGQIYTYYGTCTYKTKSFVSHELAEKLQKVNKGDLVIAVTSENVEDVGKCVVWLGDEQIVTGAHAAIFRHNQDPKYVAYWFQTNDFFTQKKRIAKGTKVIDLTPQKLEEVTMPVPPLPVQREIVQILDNFTELTARKVQYKEVLITIRKAIDASPELRSKKQLIETFIADVNDVNDVVTEWNAYVSEQREKELTQIIQEEKLKEPETRKYLANAFRDGEIKTVGTDIDKLMPPVSRFGGGGRTQKKQTVIDKLKEFFDKYFGVGGSSMSEENS